MGANECPACGYELRQGMRDSMECTKCDWSGDPFWMEGMTNKFCGVIKHDDAVKYLNDKDKGDFNYCCSKIEMGRRRDGKRPVNAYLIINVDEPYAEEVVAILKRHGHWG